MDFELKKKTTYWLDQNNQQSTWFILSNTIMTYQFMKIFVILSLFLNNMHNLSIQFFLRKRNAKIRFNTLHKIYFKFNVTKTNRLMWFSHYCLVSFSFASTMNIFFLLIYLFCTFSLSFSDFLLLVLVIRPLVVQNLNKIISLL